LVVNEAHSSAILTQSVVVVEVVVVVVVVPDVVVFVAELDPDVDPAEPDSVTVTELLLT
jgi:hypothetical protein